MATVGALKTKISLDSAQFQQSLSSVNRKLKGLQQEQKAATASGTGFARGVDELRTKSDILTRTLNVQQTKVQELRRRYEESRKATGDNSKETQNAQIAYNKAVAEMNKTETALKNITAELERQTNPWNVLSKNMDSTGRKFQEFGGKMKSFGRNMTVGVTTPIAGLGGLMLKTGMDFEAAMSNVQAISGATGDDLAKLQDKAREMGAATTKSASEAADGLSYMALAGWDTEQMLQGIEPVLRLSEAGNIDLARASDLVTDSMSALQIEVKDLPNFLDTVAQAARKSNTNIDTLMEAFLVAGGNLAQFNVPLDESTALLGLLANRGLKGSEAGRALNAIMVNLTSGAGQAGKALEELELSAFDADGNFIGLEETLRLVNERTKDMTDEQKAQYISMIAGKEHLKSFQGLLAGLDDEYSSLKDNIANADGSLNDMAETMQSNARGNVTRLKSAFEELSIQFAEHLIPMFTAGIEKVTGLVQKFSELDDDTKKNIITMAGFAAAIGPVALVVGNLTTAIGGVLRVGSKLSSVIGKSGGNGLAGRVGLLGLAGPGGLAVAGIAALSAGVLILNENMHKLHDISTDAADAMMDQYQANIPMIDSFDELRKKSGLTNDEFARYMDLQSMLESESDPEAIAAIKDEMSQLQGKSNLSNKELDKMVGYNNKLVETIPEATVKITDQGNRVADTTNKLKDYNQEIANMARRELESQLQKSLANEKEIREQIKEAQLELNRLTEIEFGLREIVKAKEDGSIDSLKEKLLLEQKSVEKAYQEAAMHGEVSQELSNRKNNLEKLLALADMDLDNVRETLGNTISLVDEQNELIEGKKAELNKTGEIVAKMIEQELIASGISEEKAKQAVKDAEVSSLLDEQIDALREQKKELYEQTDPALQVNDSFIANVKAIDDQIERLKGAKGNIGDLIDVAQDYNKELAKDIEKIVDTKTNPSIDKLNRDLASSITKRINVDARINGAAAIQAYAAGTYEDVGGFFMAGVIE